MNRILLITSLCVCLILINACGQSGDLYLPAEEPKAEQAAEKSQVEESQQEEKED